MLHKSVIVTIAIQPDPMRLKFATQSMMIAIPLLIIICRSRMWYLDADGDGYGSKVNIYSCD